MNTIYLILLTAGIYFGLDLLPLGIHPVVDIIIRSLIIVVVYLTVVLKFDLAPEIAGQIRGYMKRIIPGQR